MPVRVEPREVPAVYRTVKERRVVTPERTEPMLVPAVTVPVSLVASFSCFLGAAQL